MAKKDESIFEDADVTGDSKDSDSGESSADTGSSADSDLSSDDSVDLDGTPAPATSTPAPTSDPAAEDAVKTEIAQVLNQKGIHCDPKAETVVDFLKHVLTGLKTEEGVKAKMKADEQAANAAETGVNAGAAAGATEEQKPYMMSADGKRLELSAVVTLPLDKIHPDHRPLARQFQGMHQKAQKKAVAKRLAKVALLEKAGLPKTVTDGLRKRVEGYQLSMLPDGSYDKQDLDRELAIRLEDARHFKGAQHLSTLLDRAEQQKRPLEDDADGLAQLARDRAARVSVGSSKNGNGSAH